MEKKRRLTGKLTRRNRLIDNLLNAGIFDGADIAETTRFANRLETDARLWLARGGFGQRGRISKLDAEMMWRKEFARVGAT